MLSRPGATRKLPERVRLHAESQAAIERQIKEYMAEWKRDGNEADAEELVAASVFLKEFDAEIRAAAKTVAVSVNSPTALRSIALQILDGKLSNQDSTIESEDSRVAIKQRKQLIKLNPRDALLRAEMALLYANLGQLAKSEALLRQALAIAPHSRYVIRSAARFFCHVDRPDEALWIIRRTPRHLTDPWLRAAELAVSSVAENGISDWRRAKALSEDDSLSFLDRSELASEIATLELHAGSRRSAIKKLQLAVIDPSENAVAQIEFLTRKSVLMDRGEVSPDVTKSMEARAYRSYWLDDISDAFSACEEWQALEPFSTRPAIFGSFLSTSQLTNLDRCLNMAKGALIGNPNNAALLNNLAVLCAYTGDLDGARQYAARSRVCEDDKNSVANKATEGLIYFREGNTDSGISTYNVAMELATKERRVDLLLRAYAFFAREMCLLNPVLKVGIKAEFDRVEETLKKRGASMPKDVKSMKEEFNITGAEILDEQLKLIGFRSELLEGVLGDST